MNTSRRQFQAYRSQLARPDGSPDDLPLYGRGASKRRTRGFGELFRTFWGLMRGHRRGVVFALATLTVATLLKLLPPAAMKVAVDYVLRRRPLPQRWTSALPLPADPLALLVWLAIGVAAVSLLATLIHLWGRWHATRAVNRMQVALRHRVFEHAVRLPLHQVYRLKSGGAASLLRDDAGGAADLVFSMIYNPWRALVQLTGSLLVLMLVDWRMMLGGLMLLPVVLVTHRTWIHRIRPMWRDVRNQRQSIDASTTEVFGGMRIVRAFARERTEVARFVRDNNLLIRQQLFVWWWSRIVDVVWEMLIPLASTALLLYGGYRILQGSMTLGDLTMFLFYLAMLLEPLATLVSSAATFQNNLAGLDRVLDLLDQPQAMPAQADAVDVIPSQVAGRITFRDVRFAYPESRRWVLEDINLDVQSGETLALVGRSGAGKTTLCNLVARFYDPTEGRIELDGRDLRKIRVDSYRRLFGIVEQDVFLFDGTIADNIAYGRGSASMAEIRQAAQAANADEFIEQLEGGYQAVIGERGVKLSGGQRQRLAIARALLADPKILVLDEATSNLDSESERLIQQSLRRLMEGRTCFVIAHRMSTVILADRIALMSGGRIVQLGTHQELLQSSVEYQRMIALQTLDSEVTA
jgi:ATP-binding cassette subfamily B protein/subfamily B ATP-binding cassette protein MsbA